MLNAPAPELLAAIVDSSDDGILSKTLEGIVTSWNRAAERIFGYSPEEAIGHPIATIIPPDRLDEEDRLRRQVGSGQRVEHLHTERLHRDGRRIPVVITLSPVRNARGEIVGVSSIVRDMSERASLERRAATAAAELDRVLATVGEGFVVFDRELRYVFANDAAVRLVGLPREAVIGRTPWELFPPEIVDEAVPKIQAAMAESRVIQYELYYPAGDRWYENRLYPTPDGASLFFTDITPRKRAEQALRESAEAQRLLVSLNDATRGLRDPEAVMWEFVTRVGAHFRVGRCTYGEIDAAQEHVLVTRDYTRGVRSVVGRHRLDDFGPPLIADLKAGRTVVVPDVAADARTADDAWLRAFAGIQVRSLLCVPLVKEDRFVALLVLHHPEPRHWSASDVALLEQIAERTWFAVENARAEAALRQSRDVLSLAMRSARMGAWSRDLATDEVWWSRELEEIFGLPPGTFSGTREGFLTLVHDDDRPRLEQAVERALANGDDYEIEFRFRHASQGWRWMEGRGRAVRLETGRPIFLYGIGIDVTERRLFEDALAAARDAADADAQRLSLALAAARLGDWMWDAGSDIVTFSPRAAEIFDIPPGPHMTWTALRELLHPDDRERARTAVEDAVAGHSDYAIEYRLVNGGRERWVAASGRARYDEQGTPLGMLGVVQDITRDRLLLRIDDAVRPLTDPEQITSTVARMLGQHLRVSRCAYAVVDPDQDSFALTGNYTNGVDSIVGRYRFSQFGAECLRLMRAGRPWVITDSERDDRLEDAARPAYRATAIRGVICVPILKEGRLAAAMAVHADRPRVWRHDEVELVQQAASRCWESMERARVQRERADLLEAAEAANRAKDEFMAMLGHELRNPLSPILTALQLMKLRGDSGADRERTVIERQVTHLTRLVDDLLDVSRIARGKVELRTEPLELAAVVARGVEMASPLLEERMQTLTIDVPRSGLLVQADAARLGQVVSNLLTNAAKYTPQGGQITVSAQSEDGGIVLRVRDTGIGIPAEALPRIFDLFVQGRQAIDRAQGGLGLGLTIVKNLVERHGGHVEARSEGPDRGSEFIVRLPRARAAAERPAPPDPGVEMSAAIPEQRVRVLVVDDNEDAADMLAQALRLRGYDTRVAHDGPAALRIVRSFRPDVAFLDIGLPVMDGYELAGRLRKHRGLEHLRLIAVTGYGQPSDRQKTLDAGFEHHVVKPVTVDDLVGLIAAGATDRAPDPA